MKLSSTKPKKLLLFQEGIFQGRYIYIYIYRFYYFYLIIFQNTLLIFSQKNIFIVFQENGTF